MNNYFNVIIFVIVFVLIGNVANSERIKTTIDDGHQIREVNVLVEKVDDCLTTNEVEREIKYTLSNSNIKINNNSPYTLYA